MRRLYHLLAAIDLLSFVGGIVWVLSGNSLPHTLSDAFNDMQTLVLILLALVLVPASILVALVYRSQREAPFKL